jgi:hypothetical protein
MSDRSIDKSRRGALRLMLGGAAAIPLINLAGLGTARAEDLPHLSEDDPTAQALQYKHDATQAPRADKSGTPAADQFCKNCQLIQAAEGEWRPCQIFPGKAVNENGWCASWLPQQS